MKLFVHPIIMRNLIKDLRRLEAILHENDWAEWIAVRPGGSLTNDPNPGGYKVATRFVPPDHTSLNVPRAVVARFMLDITESGDWIHGTPTICI